MQDSPSATAASRRIDLTRETDVLFWCRIFGVTAAQLRDAVHHAGHQVDEVERYLRTRNGTPRPAGG